MSKQTEATPSTLPPDRFLNRELSWLEFNRRVLEQAADPSLPLLERAKFLAITSSNLDEFMMVRVGSLKLQYDRNPMVRDPSGLNTSEQLAAIAACAGDLCTRQDRLFTETLQPLLAEANIRGVDLDHCPAGVLDAAENRFRCDVATILSPQATSPGRPFPLLPGLSMHLCVRLKPQDEPADTKSGGGRAERESTFDFAVIPIGRALPRMIPLPSDHGYHYVMLEDLVTRFVAELFPGREVLECVPFRITRNADVLLREDEAADLMVGMEDVLESRRLSRVVRLEYARGASDATLGYLSESMELVRDDLYESSGPLDLTFLFSMHGLEGFDSLRDVAWPGKRHPLIDPAESMFANITANDLLLVHPYEHFDPVVRLIEEAAVDPDVLAIKQALYRTSRNSPIVAALIRAAENGKYVSAIVELKARFDEARNIEWAREMEQAGVQVIYGIRGLKTHAKICIIVRREPHGIVRYLHFGTGNYNEVTANLYSDVSLLTCNDEFGADATAFFNAVTGASQPQPLQHLSVAPTSLRNRVQDLIEAETRRSLQGHKGEIIAKMNALVDTDVIDALYRASMAGVNIRLNIRGVCCLRPGIKGLSETIEVNSIIDRYLEHARIFYFRSGGNEKLFISSADWMPRNLDRRVELFTPILDPPCRQKLKKTLLTYFKDNTNAWTMTASGSYDRAVSPRESFRAQRVLYLAARDSAREIEAGRTRFEVHEPKPK